MDNVLRFRNMMAQQGYELTPKRAEKILKSLEKFKSELEEFDEETFDYMANMTLEEKQQARNKLAEMGKELSPAQIEETIDFILTVYRHDIE